MIDIVQTLREQHPDLGPYIVALRPGSPVVAQADPPQASPEVRAWLAEHAPEGRLERRAVRLPTGAPDGFEERFLTVAVLPTSRELAAFVLAWT